MNVVMDEMRFRTARATAGSVEAIKMALQDPLAHRARRAVRTRGVVARNTQR